MKGNGFKIGAIVAFLALSIFYLWPTAANFLEKRYMKDLTEEARIEYQEENAQRLQELQKKSLSLGLDLQGGMRVTLAVEIDELVKELASEYSEIGRASCRERVEM